jgi:hypothetical protein
MKQNIEVEGGELVLQSDEGHFAVIPAKHRREVQDMIKMGCNDCVNAYIQTLPTNEDYAEDGTLIDQDCFDNPKKRKKAGGQTNKGGRRGCNKKTFNHFSKTNKLTFVDKFKPSAKLKTAVSKSKDDDDNSVEEDRNMNFDDFVDSEGNPILISENERDSGISIGGDSSSNKVTPPPETAQLPNIVQEADAPLIQRELATSKEYIDGNYFRNTENYNNRNPEYLVTEEDAVEKLEQYYLKKGFSKSQARKMIYDEYMDYVDMKESYEESIVKTGRDEDMVKSSFMESRNDYLNLMKNSAYIARLKKEMYGDRKISDTQKLNVMNEYYKRVDYVSGLSDDDVDKVSFSDRFSKMGSFNRVTGEYESNAINDTDYHEIEHGIDNLNKKNDFISRKVRKIMSKKDGVDSYNASKEEIIARLQSLRMILIKNGKVKAGEDIDINKFDEIKDNEQYIELRKKSKLTDDEINELLRYIAQEGQRDTSNIA